MASVELLVVWLISAAVGSRYVPLVTPIADNRRILGGTREDRPLWDMPVKQCASLASSDALWDYGSHLHFELPRAPTRFFDLF